MPPGKSGWEVHQEQNKGKDSAIETRWHLGFRKTVFSS
jgi:hypothetical protein